MAAILAGVFAVPLGIFMAGRTGITLAFIGEEVPDLRIIEPASALIGEIRYRNHSLNCTELIGYDLSNPEALAVAREKKAFHSKCSTFVGDAWDILEMLL
jgi:hypothetical protein